MRVVVLASRKGGVGKTTLTGHFAVQAQGAVPVYLIDADPMLGLTKWHQARRDGPELLAKSSSLAALVHPRRHQPGLIIIDTPPAGSSLVAEAIGLADLVVVPLQPSPHDLQAIGATLETAERARKPWLLVLNRYKPRTLLSQSGLAALRAHGLKTWATLGDRTLYAAAMADGRTAGEVDPSSPAAHEMASLWGHIDAAAR